MYGTKELIKYKGYAIQPYYHSHPALDQQWGYRIWKGYELMCVNEFGCKSPQTAIIAAIKEIDRGFICKCYFQEDK